MKKNHKVAAPEFLFGFARRARLLMAGRDNLLRESHRLQFILITTDISENSRREILRNFPRLPIVQHYTSMELETFSGFSGIKVLGCKKSDLAGSLYTALKEYRVSPRSTPAMAPSGD